MLWLAEISSTSKSVAVIDKFSPEMFTSTLAKIGIVCFLSTTPITDCRHFNRFSVLLQFSSFYPVNINWIILCLLLLLRRHSIVDMSNLFN